MSQIPVQGRATEMTITAQDYDSTPPTMHTFILVGFAGAWVEH